MTSFVEIFALLVAVIALRDGLMWLAGWHWERRR